jgi:hypothetical protein
MNQLIILLFIIHSLSFFCQKDDTCHAGIYITKEDYLKNRLSHQVNTADKGYKFSFPPPADARLTIKIETPDTTLKFKEGTLFGFAACGSIFRYSAGGELYAPEDFYRVEESKGLVIYRSAFTGGDEYFYSMNPTSQIHRLSIRNLEVDFKNQSQFINAVKELSKTGERGNIEKRDEKGRFIINNLYAKYVKPRN